MQVASRQQTRFGQDGRHDAARGTWRDGRFEHDHVPATHEGHDVARGLLDEAQVGAAASRVQRRWDGDDERIGRLRVGADL
jgi:hypothetical protein